MNIHDPKTTICRLRWDYPIINFGRREARLCCRTPGKYITDEEIAQHGKDVFLNNDFQVARRLEMLQGVKHPDCNTCWRLEANKMQSPRLNHRDFMHHMAERGLVPPDHSSDTFNEFAATVGLDSPILQSHNPDMLEISLGNFCDMKCMYCSHHYSTQWASEMIKYGDIAQVSYDKEFPEPDPAFEELFWEWFNDTGKLSIKRIGIIGGEPLIMPRFYQFIDRLIGCYDGQNTPTKVSLWVVTNMNTPPAYYQKFMNYLPKLTKHFKVEIHASMESMGKQAEYIRNGVIWDRFESNIRNLLKSDHQVEFGFQMAINALNIPHLKDYLMWVKSLHDQYKKPIALKQNIISFPDWQSPLVLTPDFADYLDDTIKWLNDVKDSMMLVPDEWGKWTRYPKFLAGIANGIRTTGPDDYRKAKFYSWFKQYDQRRNLSFLDTFPHHEEFWNLCKDIHDRQSQ